MKNLLSAIASLSFSLAMPEAEARPRCNLSQYLRVSTGQCLSKRYNGQFYTVRRFKPLRAVRYQYAYSEIITKQPKRATVKAVVPIKSPKMSPIKIPFKSSGVLSFNPLPKWERSSIRDKPKMFEM